MWLKWHSFCWALQIDEEKVKHDLRNRLYGQNKIGCANLHHVGIAIHTVYLRVLVEKFSPEQNTTQTIRLIHG